MKKLLSIILTLTLIFSALPLGLFSITASAVNDVWDGEAATAFASGTGTESDPYVIATGGQLRLMVEQGAESAGKCYKLANDIYLNDVTTQNWYQGGALNSWNQMAVNEANAFCGNFNGAGHKVFGLYLNYKTANTTPTTDLTDDHDIDVAAGLIPVVGKGAVIDAVGVEKANITIKNSVTGNDSAVPAGFVGAVVGAFTGNDASNTISVSRCYAADTVALTGAFVGLIGGGASMNGAGVTVENCYSLLSWTARTSPDRNNRAGLIGRMPGGATFSGCFALGNVAGTIVNKGAVNNYVANGWISNAGTHITVSDIYGGKAAKTAMPELDWENVYMTTSSHPILQIFNSMDPSEYWNGTEVAPSKGTGTSGDPIIISTPEELAYVIKNGMSGKHYKLEKDIYLNDITKIDWATGTAKAGYTPKSWYTSATCGVLEGTFDGNGHKIYGLYFSNSAADSWALAGTGLFPSVSCSSESVDACNSFSVSKLGVDYAYVRHPNGASAFVGANRGIVNIDQSFVGANVVLKGHMAGAFIGVSDAIFTISNCYNLGTTEGAHFHGLLGDHYKSFDVNGYQGSISNSYNATGTIRTKVTNRVSETNCYGTAKSADTTTVLTAAEMQGLDVVDEGGTMAGLGNKFQATATYPVLIAFLPPAPMLASKTDTTVTLTTVSGMEYSKDGTTWQNSNVFEGLSPNTTYTFYQRVAETDTAYASEKSAGLSVTTMYTPVTPSAPTLVSKTDTTVTLTAVSGMEYSKNSTTWQNSNVFEGLSPNTTYTFYQRMAETDTAYASAISPVLVVETKLISYIEIESTITKTTYIEGEGLNPAGGKIKVHFTDGTWQTEDIALDMISGFNSMLRGKQTVTVTRTGKTATMNVWVVGPVRSITVCSEPWVTVYIKNREDLNVDGGQLEVEYRDGSYDYVDITPDMVSGFDKNKLGKQTLAVTFDDLTAYYEVEVIEYVSKFNAIVDVSTPVGQAVPWGVEATFEVTPSTADADRLFMGFAWMVSSDGVVFEFCRQGDVFEAGKYYALVNNIGSLEGIDDDTVWMLNGKPLELLEIGYDFGDGITFSEDAVFISEKLKAYTPGDLTGDDKINSLDGLMLMRYLNGWNNLNIASPEAMDVNADGKVNSLDGLLLMRYLNGWNVQLG